MVAAIQLLDFLRYVTSSVGAVACLQHGFLSLPPYVIRQGCVVHEYSTHWETSKPLESNGTTPDTEEPANLICSITGGCVKSQSQDAFCSCHKRSALFSPKQKLPFPCRPANNVKMQDWLLSRYAALTFNTCPHRALHCMAGSPIEIHVNPSAKPVACHSPASIPLHWQEKVYQDLLRDEALNILEKVTHSEPTQWCDRMVLTTKHDNTPLRTVDLSPLNKFCKREIFASKTPNHLTHQIPGRTWKTATDACNGYHKVPLRKPTVILYEILYESQPSFYRLYRTIR